MNKMLERLCDHLYSMNYRFEAKAQELLPKKCWDAQSLATFASAMVSKEDVKDLWDYLTVKDGHLVRGYASGKSLGKYNLDKS